MLAACLSHSRHFCNPSTSSYNAGCNNHARGTSCWPVSSPWRRKPISTSLTQLSPYLSTYVFAKLHFHW
jgi:hypothetical protein